MPVSLGWLTTIVLQLWKGFAVSLLIRKVPNYYFC